MSQSTRRQLIHRTFVVAAGTAALRLSESPTLAVQRSKFRINERHQLRLRVESKKLHENGRLLVALFGKPDGDDHFKDDFITWGPFGNQKGVTKPIYLDAGDYEIRSDGGFIQFSVELEGRSVRERNEKRTDYEVLASISGTIQGKG